jgi:MFS family permease
VTLIFATYTIALIPSLLVLRSLPLVLAAAVLAGTGLGFGYFGAQTEINRLAPGERRGEVTAAFISCIYLGVSVTAIGTGLLSDATSLFTAVATAGTAIAIVAAVTTAWHLATADT